MTNFNRFGWLYVAAMAAYFLVSGFSVLLDVPGKLARIDLAALNSDGEIAFILIYCSLMVGIGAACGLIAFLSRTWVYSAALAATIIASFILFRLVGSLMTGGIRDTQLGFIAAELVEVGLGVFLLKRQRGQGLREAA